MKQKKRVMCFGDSLTWGWVPVMEGQPTERYPYDERWTGVLASNLGDEFEIIEEGLSARTTCLDDPIDPRTNGSTYLPAAIASHFPLDLVIVMLGTNDTKAYFHKSPFEIAVGMSKLVGQILGSAGGVGTTYPAPRALVIAPPPLATIRDPWFESVFRGAHNKTIELAEHYKDLASHLNVHFLNSGDYVSTEGADGIHFTKENNIVLGQCVAKKVISIFGE